MSSFGIINNNVSAVNAYRTLGKTNRGLNQNLERLSSGLRINRAADDAAGLAVSEKMRGQINGLDQAVRNAEDGISMIQTAEGVMDTAHSILQRMRVLSVQAANDNYTTYDRQRLQKEVDELIGQIDRISEYTEFNTKKLLNGNALGKANSLDSRVLTASASGIVANADYSITVVQAGQASRVHGSTAWNDNNNDALFDLRDLGISGDVELHIEVDGKARAVELNEKDNINDVVRKINAANLGVLAGVHNVDGVDYLTMTSRRSGSRFNISFGDDPDGAAIALGLFGGVDNSVDSSVYAIYDDDPTNAPWLRFTSGTDTIISIVNITDQRLFPTIPPNMADESQVTLQDRILGRFVSNSDIFTEKELSTVMNQDGTVNQELTARLRDSALLKGLTINVDEDIDYGYEDMVNYDSTETLSIANHAYAAIPTGVEGGIRRGAVDYDIETLTGGTLEARQQISLVSVRLSVRDARQVFQIGANEGQTMTVDFANISAEALGLTNVLRGAGNVFDGIDDLDNGTKTANLNLNISIETQKSASSAITIVNNALNIVSEARSRLGAFQNSLEKSVDYLNISYENQVASESRIRDVDMAKEMSTFTRNQILTQSGTAMLAQANQKPQSVLSLIR
ncbi:MAG: flagellin [Candidatus Muiribacteriota bacterium]